MNDAPHDEGIEDSVWDADRVRERYDSSVVRMGVRGLFGRGGPRRDGEAGRAHPA